MTNKPRPPKHFYKYINTYNYKENKAITIARIMIALYVIISLLLAIIMIGIGDKFALFGFIAIFQSIFLWAIVIIFISIGEFADKIHKDVAEIKNNTTTLIRITENNIIVSEQQQLNNSLSHDENELLNRKFIKTEQDLPVTSEERKVKQSSNGIKITCPACKNINYVPEEKIAASMTSARCKKCNHVFKIQKKEP